MTATLAELPRGYEFQPTSFTLTQEWVDQYATAVNDQAIAAVGAAFVPPMAIAALSVRSLLVATNLPAGTLHAGQEIKFRGAAHVDDEILVTARIVSRGERAGWVLMSVDLEAAVGGEYVMTGRATVTFPLEGGAS